MFVVLTERVYKVATGGGMLSGDKFAARSTNTTRWTFAGPFNSRKLAEKVATQTLGTHTCLSAVVFEVPSDLGWDDENKLTPLHNLSKAIYPIVANGYHSVETQLAKGILGAMGKL